MKHYKLFQAWQNQNKEYTNFITKLIEQIIESEREKGIDIEVIRFPAQYESGSPDVVDMVWEQISNCDLFIGDLTEVANVDEQHSISNPNVMYEVGIADSLLGEKRVILVCSKETNIEKLAFDINHKRISPLNIEHQRAKETLQEWIEKGIEECDIQNLQRDFVFRDLYEDVFVIYNNFMRIVYNDDFEYSKGVCVPNLETLKEKLKSTKLNELMISVDYKCIIDRLEKEIRNLYMANNRRYISEIINIYVTLDRYNFFMQYIKKDSLFKTEEEYYEALLHMSKAFYITDAESVELYYGSILFGDKYVYTVDDIPFRNVYLKEMFTEKIKKECHCQNIQMGEGSGTMIKTLIYSIKDNAVNKYSQYVYDVLIAVYNFMDKMNFSPTNTNEEFKYNTIITWEKSK